MEISHRHGTRNLSSPVSSGTHLEIKSGYSMNTRCLGASAFIIMPVKIKAFRRPVETKLNVGVCHNTYAIMRT